MSTREFSGVTEVFITSIVVTWGVHLSEVNKSHMEGLFISVHFSIFKFYLKRTLSFRCYILNVKEMKYFIPVNEHLSASNLNEKNFSAVFGSLQRYFSGSLLREKVPGEIMY